MIKFHTEKEEITKPLTFGDIEIEQFFIDANGYLCQKVTNDAFNIITDSNGFPSAAFTTTISRGTAIMKKLERVTKITWD